MIQELNLIVLSWIEIIAVIKKKRVQNSNSFASEEKICYQITRKIVCNCIFFPSSIRLQQWPFYWTEIPIVVYKLGYPDIGSRHSKSKVHVSHESTCKFEEFDKKCFFFFPLICFYDSSIKVPLGTYILPL